MPKDSDCSPDSEPGFENSDCNFDFVAEMDSVEDTDLIVDMDSVDTVVEIVVADSVGIADIESVDREE